MLCCVMCLQLQQCITASYAVKFVQWAYFSCRLPLVSISCNHLAALISYLYHKAYCQLIHQLLFIVWILIIECCNAMMWCLRMLYNYNFHTTLTHQLASIAALLLPLIKCQICTAVALIVLYVSVLLQSIECLCDFFYSLRLTTTSISCDAYCCTLSDTSAVQSIQSNPIWCSNVSNVIMSCCFRLIYCFNCSVFDLNAAYCF
jgi:hypothetical protein